MAEVWQEMHCSPSGGGCGVWFSVHFEDTFTGNVGIRCGICKHPHCRRVVKGVLKEEGRVIGGVGKQDMEVEILQSACYPEPRSQAMLKKMGDAVKKRCPDVRDGMTEDEAVLARKMQDDEKGRRQIIMDLWYDKYKNEQFG